MYVFLSVLCILSVLKTPTHLLEMFDPGFLLTSNSYGLVVQDMEFYWSDFATWI